MLPEHNFILDLLHTMLQHHLQLRLRLHLLLVALPHLPQFLLMILRLQLGDDPLIPINLLLIALLLLPILIQVKRLRAHAQPAQSPRLLIHMILQILRLFLLFVFFDDFIVEVELLRALGILLFQKDELFEQQLAVVLLGFQIVLDFVVVCSQEAVLLFDPLGDVGDELQMVVQLVLPAFDVGCLGPLEHGLLFDGFLHLVDDGGKSSHDVLLLLILQHGNFFGDPSDIILQLVVEGRDDLLVFLMGVHLVACPDP